MIRRMMHPSVLGQGVSLVASVLLIALFSRSLLTADYAVYVMATALWAIGNAVIGTAIGTRVAREAANGVRNIDVFRSEIGFTLITSTAIGGYVYFATQDLSQSFLSGLTMLSFVISEVRIAFEIGRKDFRKYLVLLSIKALIPIAIFYICGSIIGFGLDLALVATSMGNLVLASIWPRVWGRMVNHSSESFGRSVGILNLGLWIVASADRILMERFADAFALAIYALTYGLLDKGFRALSNSMVTRFLGDALKSGHPQLPKSFYVGTAGLAIFAVPCAVIGAELVSGGRYVPGWGLSAVISAALLFMVWSTPGYLMILRQASFQTSIVAICAIAIINIISNLVTIGKFGSIAAAINSLISYILWFIWIVKKSRVEIIKS